MNHTQGKLDEAKFFLGELERTYYEYVGEFAKDNPKPPVCKYYLSAFISSARSVLWVMRYEYHDVEGWEEWYKSKESSREREEEEFLKKINDIRVRSEKKTPLNLAANFELNQITDANSSTSIDEATPEWRRKRFKLKSERVLESGEEVSEEKDVIEMLVEVKSFYWAIEEFPGQDVLTICKSYYSFLEKMVEECKHLFPVA